TEIERDRLSLDITEVTNSFAKGSQRRCGLTGSGRQDTDARHFGRLLRARREWPRGCRAAEQHDELAPFHSITSSARASSVGGTSMPSAFAVVRLIARSNLVGCSTGMSAGFAPRKILSTNSPARRNRSV